MPIYTEDIMSLSYEKKIQYRSILTVVLAILSQWTCSIALVFTMKHLLTDSSISKNLPFFITWCQCLITSFIYISVYSLSRRFMSDQNEAFHDSESALKKIALGLSQAIQRDDLLSIPFFILSCMFILKIVFNNLSIKNVDVSFYYMGKSLNIIFVMVLSQLLLPNRSRLTIPLVCCCLLILVGFGIGTDQEKLAGALTLIGSLLCVIASFIAATNNVLIKRILPESGKNSIWRVSATANIWSTMLLPAVVVLSGEFKIVLENWDALFYSRFTFFLPLIGILGWLVGATKMWEIYLISPLSHCISSTAKSAVQTITASVFRQELRPILWWTSNGIIMIGSVGYTWFRMKANKVEKSAKGECVEPLHPDIHREEEVQKMPSTRELP